MAQTKQQKTGNSPAGYRPNDWMPPDFGAPFIPTEDEIAAGCREIQERWDADEERSRRRWNSVGERVELVNASDFSHRKGYGFNSDNGGSINY